MQPHDRRLLARSDGRVGVHDRRRHSRKAKAKVGLGPLDQRRGHRHRGHSRPCRGLPSPPARSRRRHDPAAPAPAPALPGPVLHALLRNASRQARPLVRPRNNRKGNARRGRPRLSLRRRRVPRRAGLHVHAPRHGHHHPRGKVPRDRI
eukprot:Amastigsp_a509260_75.p4 type:complete len:149 gc:universal Amastigsp_a509260_75:1180-734(-)